MKVISISLLTTRLTTSSYSLFFLIRPGTTVEQVLDQLGVEDYVLFPAPDPARLFDYKDTLYDRVENGSCLIAAGLAEASAVYRRSRAQLTPNNILLETRNEENHL
jgi:hypothetical protein